MGDEAYVWFIRTATVSDAEGATAQDLLSAEERERQLRLGTDALRRDFAIKRALVRLGLSHHAEVDPSAWSFGTVENGRPCIVSPAPGDLDFSVSDTTGLVALLIARGVRTAIDVEHLDPRVNADRMARRYFSPEEQAEYFALEESLRHRRFFELWTAKEAYVKALGAGFAQSFRKFAIHFDPPRIGNGWSFVQLDLGDNYAATVAMRGKELPVVVRDAQPLMARSS